MLIITGILAATNPGALGLPIWLIAIFISIAAFAGGELGYLIGHKVGPRIFERTESGLFSIANVKRTNAFFERFGPLAVIIARFVPVIRTFAPIMAGVGHMSYRRYSLFNAIGAVVWGMGITLAGFGIGHIPPVADFVSSYIDLILLGAVLATVIPIAIHYFHGVHQAKKAEASGEVETPQVSSAPHDAEDRGHARACRSDHPEEARAAQSASAATRGAIARNARERWLTAFFSSAVSSAALRLSPSGRNTGS